MSLPTPWIDRIFSKMTVTYGSAWLRMWEGVDIDAVKFDWGNELAGFQQSPEAIRHGLEHLPPDRPPTVLQFRDLCRKAPLPEFKALPWPEATPERVMEAIARMKPPAHRGPKAWAWDLKRREEQGEKLHPLQARWWREALRVETNEAMEAA